MTRPKKTNAKTFLAGYKHDESMFLGQRAAHCLVWAAQHHPRIFVEYNVLLRGIMGYGKTPSAKGKECERLRSNMSNVRRVLERDYKCGLVVQPGLGVRATVDDEDRTRFDLRQKMDKLAGAKKRAQNTLNDIDGSKVKDRHLKRYLNWGARHILRACDEADFDTRALPPPDEDGKGKPPKKK